MKMINFKSFLIFLFLSINANGLWAFFVVVNFYNCIEFRFCFFFLVIDEFEFEKTTEDVLLNDVPHIVANSIINATLGKSVELICTVHNLRNYKVSKLEFEIKLPNCFLIKISNLT